MADRRPNPDELLARVQATESQASRGALKIFFGYAAGVGKTYAMLENAQRAKAEGRDVVAGYVEPHSRPATEALLQGLEVLPPSQHTYRGVTLREFDVDAALSRHPEILLVDELAHTNVEGSRHTKRWQDIEELLDAGITVWTTLNVQHIESLNDVIGRITGIWVKETVPDRIFDEANDLELADITPEELIDRLRAGKIYLPEQAKRAIERFFQKPHLAALRELSLRQAAQRIHTEVEGARREKSAIHPWATADRLLVCIGPSPTTSRVIRTAKRMATALNAPWLAISVDLTGAKANSPIQQSIAQHFRLAEQLGAETVTIAGQDIAGSILDYARSRNVTKILIGKTAQPRWRRLLLGNVVDDVLENSGEIDVYVIHGEEETREATRPQRRFKQGFQLHYLIAVLLVAGTGVLAWILRMLHLADTEANTVMLFLAAVASVAFAFGRGPSILASVVAVLFFDFFFVPPLNTFAVADAEYTVTFVVMLAISMLISTLASRLRGQVESTRLRERRTSALYQLGKQLSSLYGQAFLISAAGTKLVDLVEGEVAIYLKHASHDVEIAFGQGTAIARHPVSSSVAHWVIQHEQIAGTGTNTLPNAVAVFLPLVDSQGARGAIAVRTAEMERLLEPDQRRFLEACASQLALALERDQLAIDASEARIHAESEQLRSSLLSSVSHDLKTPLAAIAGASSSLLETTSLSEETRQQLLETVAQEAARLNRLLENILQMSKLEAGAASPNRQWHVLEEIVGSALHRTAEELQHHPVTVQLPGDLPLIHVDGLLIEQILVNLLENAARYTPPGTKIMLRAAVDGKSLRLTVADEGPGLPVGSEERIFEKFYRASPIADAGRGSGLGLAICRAVAKAHGGNMTASNRPEGGAELMLVLPLSNDAPQVVVE